MTLGEKLASLRKEKNITQEQMAEELGVTRQTISKWELDQSKPDLQYISDLSNFFQVTLDYLIKDEEKKSMPETTTNEPTFNAQNISLYNVEKKQNFYKAYMVLIAIFSAISIIDYIIIIIQVLISGKIFYNTKDMHGYLSTIHVYFSYAMYIFTYTYSFFLLKKNNYSAVILCQIFIRVLFLMEPLNIYSTVISKTILSLIEFATDSLIIIFLFLLFTKKLKSYTAFYVITIIEIVYFIATYIITLIKPETMRSISPFYLLIGYAPTMAFLLSLKIITLDSYSNLTTDKSISFY